MTEDCKNPSTTNCCGTPSDCSQEPTVTNRVVEALSEDCCTEDGSCKTDGGTCEAPAKTDGCSGGTCGE